MKTYDELAKIESFEDRLAYLMLLDYNEGSPRGMSMSFYKSDSWRKARQEVLSRDGWCDLGVPGVFVTSKLIVHHINPITAKDLNEQTSKLLDLNNLITVSVDTHNIIHYGKKKEDLFEERSPGDTKLW